MRLEKLELRDFQVHEKTTVHFSPGITTIRGPTDTGKSAIIRALRWLCENNLSGDEFIREGEKRTSVTLHTDGHQITRTKATASIGTNTYEMDGKILRAFGSDVPSDITDLLRLSAINFQGQHDSPFWFNETAGEVSRRLNAVVDLSVIDSTLANIATRVRKAVEKKDLIFWQHKETQSNYEEIKDQRERIDEFHQLEEQHRFCLRLQKDCDQLADIIRRIDSHQRIVRRSEAQRDDGEVVLQVGREVLDLSERADQLTLLIRDAARLRKTRTPPDLSLVESSFKEWRRKREQAENLAYLVRRVLEQALTADAKGAAVTTAERKFHKALEGANCPLCGARLAKLAD